MVCGHGGIGRLGGFRFHCQKRAGSSPVARTKAGGDFRKKIAACLVLFSLPFSLFSFLSPHRPPAMRCRSGGMPPLLHSCSILPTAPHPVPSGPHSRGMTATGSHGYFHSLRGAQPYTGEPFLRRTNSPLLRKIFNFPFLFSFRSSLFSKKPAHAGNSAWADRVVSDIRFSSSGAG